MDVATFIFRRSNKYACQSGHKAVSYAWEMPSTLTPSTGMGTSLALIGAYVFFGELSEFIDAQHASDALEAYEYKFRAYIEASQTLPFLIPGIAYPKGRYTRWLP